MTRKSPIACAAIVLAVSLGVSLAAAGDDPASFDYRRAGDALIVKFSETVHVPPGGDPGPTLEIYGDGRATVHRPPSMTNPGDRSFKLSDDELVAIVTLLVEKNIPLFNQYTAEDAKRAALQVRAVTGAGRLPAVPAAERPTTTIELHLERYHSPGAGPRGFVRLDRRVTWVGLEADARDYPDIRSLQLIAEARSQLLRIFERRDAGND